MKINRCLSKKCVPKWKKAVSKPGLLSLFLWGTATVALLGQNSNDSLAHHPLQPVNVQSVNTPEDDYWPAISADNAFFATTVSRRRETGYQASQEDLSIFTRDEKGEWRLDTLLTKPLNTSFNEGSPAFSTDGRYLFFVAADRNDGAGSCDIYYTVRHGNRWLPPMHPGAPLNTRFWESNPSLSADGRTLYFVSNRTGGKGGMDIWKCSVAIQSDGLLRFFNAENLNDSINTPKNESSPFIHPDGETLYFSSDGHGGLGGNDIFVARKNNAGQWQRPLNIGGTINTAGDDTGFVVETSGCYAYFSSNGLEQNGCGREIYRVALPSEVRPQKTVCIQGVVSDADESSPMRALVEMTDLSTGQKYSTTFSDDVTGKFSVCYPAGKKYGLSISARPYLFESIGLNDSAQKVTVHLQKIEKGRRVALRNVYFAFDSYNLQPESTPELKQLGRFLLDYPTVKIEIAGHTDNVGQAAYNLDLSAKRAKAVVDFLIRGGIAAERLTYKGYGTSRPVASNDTEQGRAQNRRTEVEIK
jgi:outer membrane protein OmpA-like peptidoglycan-associated protein